MGKQQKILLENKVAKNLFGHLIPRFDEFTLFINGIAGCGHVLQTVEGFSRSFLFSTSKSRDGFLKMPKIRCSHLDLMISGMN